jgi:hypothetical protein
VYAFEIGRIERAPAPRQGADHRVAVRRSSSASSPLSWPTRSAGRDEVAALETALAAAHGELLELRRQLGVGQPRRAA